MTESSIFEGASEADGSGGQANSSGIPPYIPFATLLTFLGELKTNGLPPQIDSSVLRRFSGGTQNQLKVALRYLGLMDGAKPTQKLADLVDAYETPTFDALLYALLQESYPFVFALDLMTATPTMFADAFKGTGAKEDVSRKCRTFFLHAAKKAGVPLGNRILTGSVPRSAPSANGAKKRPKTRKVETIEQGGEPAAKEQPANGQISDKAMEYKLVDLMKEDDITESERAAIWTLIQYLTKRGKNKATDQQ